MPTGSAWPSGPGRTCLGICGFSTHAEKQGRFVLAVLCTYLGNPTRARMAREARCMLRCPWWLCRTFVPTQGFGIISWQERNTKHIIKKKKKILLAREGVREEAGEHRLTFRVQGSIGWDLGCRSTLKLLSLFPWPPQPPPFLLRGCRVLSLSDFLGFGSSQGSREDNRSTWRHLVLAAADLLYQT